MRSAFAEFKDSDYARKALLKYDKTPFSYSFDNAKNKDQEAIVYFTLKSLGPLYSAFNNFYVRGRNLDLIEKSHDFFSEYFTRLLAQTEDNKGPFFYFDPEKLPNQPSENLDEWLLNKLRYYMYGYATALATKLYKKEIKRSRNETDMNAPEDLEDTNITNPIENIASKEISTEEKISGDVIYNNKPFMDFLKQKFPKWYKFVILLYKKKDPIQVAKAMGWKTDNGIGGKRRSTPSQVYNGGKFIKDLYKKFMDAKGDMSSMKRKKKAVA